MTYHEHDHGADDATLRRGTLVALPGCIGNFLTSTLLAVLFARWMGVDEFGVFAFAFNLIRILTLVAGMGFNLAAMRLLPRYRKAADQNAVNGFILGAAAVSVVLGIACGFFLYGIAMVLGDTHGHRVLIHAIWLIPLLALGLLLAGILRAHGRVLLGTMAQGGVRDLIAIGLAWLIAGGAGGLLAQDALIALGAAMVLAVLLQLFDLRIGRILTTDKPGIHFRQWIGVSMPMSIGAVTRLIAVGGDVILLRLMMGEAQAGLFHAAIVLALATMIPARAVLAAASPMLSHHADPGDMPIFRRIANRALLVAGMGSAAIAVVLVATGEDLLALYGPGFTDIYPVLIILSVASVAYAVSFVSGSTLFMLGQSRLATRIILVGAASILALSAVGIVIDGMTGAALGYLISRLGIAATMIALTRRQMRRATHT